MPGVPSSISPLPLPPASPLVLHLNRASACKVRAPSCEGLSLFFSQAAERQQAVSKSVPRVTPVEEAVRAGQELRRRRLPHLAACQGRSTLRASSLSRRLPGLGVCPAPGFILDSEKHLTAEGCGGNGSEFHQAFILVLGSSPFLMCRRAQY